MLAMAKMIAEKKPYAERLVVKTEGKIKFQPVAEILWVESEGNYLKIHTVAESFQIRETMTNFSAKLNPELFLRIHKSFLVNVSQIKEMKPWFNDEHVIILKNGAQLPVGRTYKKSLFSFLNL